MTNVYAVTTNKDGLIGIYKSRSGAIEEAINHASLFDSSYKRSDSKYGDSVIVARDVTINVEVWFLGQ